MKATRRKGIEAATVRMEHGGTWMNMVEYDGSSKVKDRTSKHHHVRQKVNMWVELRKHVTKWCIASRYLSRQKNGARTTKKGPLSEHHPELHSLSFIGGDPTTNGQASSQDGCGCGSTSRAEVGLP